jgi:hypothetical protein
MSAAGRRGAQLSREIIKAFFGLAAQRMAKDLADFRLHRLLVSSGSAPQPLDKFMV